MKVPPQAGQRSEAQTASGIATVPALGAPPSIRRGWRQSNHVYASAPVRQPRGQKLKHRLARRALELGQRLRLDLPPRHFYSQVPDLRGLRATDRWREPASKASLSLLHVEAPDELVRVLQGYWPVRRDRGIAFDPLNGDRHWPSPLYLERTGGAD